MKILNALLLINKNRILETPIQKTIIDQQIKFCYGFKLLTIANKNILNQTISNDLIYPKNFFKGTSSFLTLKQVFDRTVLYVPFLNHAIKTKFVKDQFRQLFRQHRLFYLSGIVIKITQISKENMPKDDIVKTLKNLFMHKEIFLNLKPQLYFNVYIGLLGLKFICNISCSANIVQQIENFTVVSNITLPVNPQQLEVLTPLSQSRVYIK